MNALELLNLVNELCLKAREIVKEHKAAGLRSAFIISEVLDG